MEFPVKISIKTKTVQKWKGVFLAAGGQLLTSSPGGSACAVTPPLAAGSGWWSPRAHHRNSSQTVGIQSAMELINYSVSPELKIPFFPPKFLIVCQNICWNEAISRTFNMTYLRKQGNIPGGSSALSGMPQTEQNRTEQNSLLPLNGQWVEEDQWFFWTVRLGSHHCHTPGYPPPPPAPRRQWGSQPCTENRLPAGKQISKLTHNGGQKCHCLLKGCAKSLMKDVLSGCLFSYPPLRKKVTIGSLKQILLINTNRYSLKDNKYKGRKQLQCQLHHQMLLKNKLLLCLLNNSFYQVLLCLTTERSVPVSTWIKHKTLYISNQKTHCY